MRGKYKNLSQNPSNTEIQEWLRLATRERDLDLEDYERQISYNPFIYTAPSSSIDLKGTEKVGDEATSGDTLYKVVDDSGNVWRRMSYVCAGDMYQYDTGTTITVTTSGTFYDVTSMSSSYTVNVTFANTHELVVQKAGIYKVDWTLSVSDGSGTPNVKAGIGKGGTIQQNTASESTLKGSGSLSVLSGSGFVDCAASDVITLMVSNETNTNNLTVQHCNVTLTRYDDT